MKPVRVKAYGLVNFTKKQYLITQGLVLFSAICIVIFGSFVSIDALSFKYATYLFVFAMIMEVGETVIMLYKFRQKEKARLNAVVAKG